MTKYLFVRTAETSDGYLAEIVDDKGMGTNQFVKIVTDFPIPPLGRIEIRIPE